jgi:hypothetical protein
VNSVFCEVSEDMKLLNSYRVVVHRTVVWFVKKSPEITVVWVIAPRSLVEIGRRFTGA